MTDAGVLPSGLDLHTFSLTTVDAELWFQVLVLDGGVYVWIGTEASHGLKNLSVASPLPFNGIPSTTTVLGPCLDSFGERMARRLAATIHKAVYVSYNGPEMSPRLQQAAEKRVLEELKDFHLL